MKLSSSLVGKLVKAASSHSKDQNEEIVYGTIKRIEDETYIVLDGSTDPTPARTTVTVNDGDRVSGVLKNHVVLITGNATDNSAAESDVKKNRTSINRLNDSITLQIVDTSGETTAEIKMEDYKIKLTGDVIANSLSVAALFAKDINVTGAFKIDNGKIRLLATDDGVSFSAYNKEYAEDPLYHPAQLLLGENKVFIGSQGKGGPTIDVAGTRINLTGEVFIDGNIFHQTSDGNAWNSLPDIYSTAWTPTLNNVASYTLQNGCYATIGSLTIVSFRLKGTFDDNTGSALTISGCPVKPESNYAAGGGNLSGYHAADNIVFTGWAIDVNGNIKAMGQWATTKDNARYTGTIYPRSGATFDLAGTIAF